MSIHNLIPETYDFSYSTNQAPKTFETLPFDLLSHIQKFLNPPDIQALTATSSTLQNASIYAANVNSIHAMKSYIQALISLLDPELNADLIQALDQLNDSILNQEHRTLIDLKKQLLDTKNQIINLLLPLDLTEFALLEKVAPPHFCKDLFQIATLCRELPTIAENNDLAMECHRRLKIYLKLFELKAFDRPELEESLTQAIGNANEIQDPMNRSMQLTCVFKALIKTNRMDQAEPIIAEAIAIAQAIPDVEERSYALQQCSLALCDAKEFERSIAIAKDIPRPAIQSLVLSRIFPMLIQAGMIERAYDIRDDASLPSYTLLLPQEGGNILLNWCLALCEVNEFEQAVDLANTAELPYLRSFIFAKIFTPIAEGGRRELAEEILNQATALANLHSNPQERGWLLKHCSLSWLEIKEFKRASQVAQSIEDLEMRGRALKNCARALLKEDLPFEAYSIGKTIPDPNLQGRVFFDCSEAFFRQKAFGEALEAAKGIDNNLWRDQALRPILNKYFEVQDFEKTAEVAKALSNLQLKDAALLYSSTGLCEIGDHASAFSNIALIGNEEQKGEALRCYINALINAKQLDQAVETLPLILNLEHKEAALLSCSLALLQAGRFAEGIELARTISNEALRWEALQNCVYILADAKKFDLAIEIAKSISKDSRSMSLAKIALALLQAGELNWAIDIGKIIPDFSLQAKTLLSIVNVRLAKGVFDRVEEIIFSIDWMPSRNLAWESYATALGNVGEFLQAMEKIEKILDEEKRSDALQTLIKLCIQAKQKDLALKIADRIPNREKMDLSLMQITEAYAKTQEFDQALHSMEGIKRKSLRFKMTITIAAYMTHFGHTDRALQLSDSLPPSFKWNSHAEMAKIMTRKGETIGAKELVKTIPNEGLRRNTLFAMIEILISQKEFDLAIELADQIDDIKARERALSSLYFRKYSGRTGEF